MATRHAHRDRAQWWVVSFGIGSRADDGSLSLSWQMARQLKANATVCEEGVCERQWNSRQWTEDRESDGIGEERVS